MTVEFNDDNGLTIQAENKEEADKLRDMFKSVPNTEVHTKLKISIDLSLDAPQLKEDTSFNYQLLGRLVTDCEYFLGHGNRCEKHLWAGNVKDQIAKMKELWNGFSQKPEWLTMEQIEKYEKDMKKDS